ncbi:MAG: hypothetical protein PHW72_01910 [Candidatus Pacebacteria bacterium]|nr:hypothetical protein [Candidatus Paceibacterota bacterium]
MKRNFQKEWQKISSETHEGPEYKPPYPKRTILTRELLLCAQVILGKIENKEEILFNNALYEKVMNEYYHQNYYWGRNRRVCGVGPSTLCLQPITENKK